MQNDRIEFNQSNQSAETEHIFKVGVNDLPFVWLTYNFTNFIHINHSFDVIVYKIEVNKCKKDTV